jgi:hypothetical protein
MMGVGSQHIIHVNAVGKEVGMRFEKTYPTLIDAFFSFVPQKRALYLPVIKVFRRASIGVIQEFTVTTYFP